MNKRLSRLIISIIGLSFALSSHALIFNLPKKGDSIIGEITLTKLKPGESLEKVGRRYDVGYYELIEANPHIDPKNLYVGQTVVIPSSFILPDAPRKGIVVNLAEMRMYYYTPDGKHVITYPIGIGRLGWKTPEGEGKIIEKRKDPTWHVPESIRKDREKDGVFLPKFIGPGPNNPLGRYAMRLSFIGYEMHGTNDPSGIGKRSSSGCIRMLPEDSERLFNSIDVGTPVRIVNQPYKIGWLGGQLYLEAHQPLQEQGGVLPTASLAETMQPVNAVIQANDVQVNWNRVKQIMHRQEGVPEIIGGPGIDAVHLEERYGQAFT